MSRISLYLVLAVTSPAWACRPRNLEDSAGSAPEPPPAAAIATAADSIPLAQQLQRLEEVTRTALSNEGGDALRVHILQAEALTDRLLEARLPYQWMANQYSLEARLRQLQALADRIVAEVRRDEPGETIHQDLSLMLDRVGVLRQELRLAGGPAPPSIDSLLAGMPQDTLPHRASGEPDEDEQRGGEVRLLGRAVNDTTGG